MAVRSSNTVWSEGVPKMSDRDLDANIHIFKLNVSDLSRKIADGSSTDVSWTENCLMEDREVLEILVAEKRRRADGSDTTQR